MNRTARQHIFISYRRDDARGASGRLYDWLRIAFGGDKVFRDVASIGIGRWRDKIDAALADCAVCIAVIGQHWANVVNLPRLHDANDMVRHELLRALGDGAMIMVPALVENAPIPAVASLPAELRPLFDIWNARPLREDGWEDDMRRLIGELAEATGLTAGPDIDTLMRAQQRVAELERAQQLQTEQVAALRTTIDELTRKFADATPADRPGLAAAFAELAQGRAEAAEYAFEREYEARARADREAKRDMAEAARNVANLAMLHNVKKAIAFYWKALETHSDHSETARLLGDASIAAGDLSAAKAAFERSLASAETQADDWAKMAAHGGLGDVAVSAGDLDLANSHFRAALSIAESRYRSNTADPQWQHGLLSSLNRLGDMLVAQGDGSGALDTFHKCLCIAESLATHSPTNSQWQRGLPVSYSRIGDVLLAQGDQAGALAAFRKSHAILEALAARDPANSQWQHDISVSYKKIGNVLANLDDVPGALAAFREGLAIAKGLVARDPANLQWQRDLSVSFNRIGDMLVAQGDRPSALEALRASYVIFESLAARDPANSHWQRDLSVGLVRMGDVLVTLGDLSGALTAFRKSHAIFEALTERDPANSHWQRDLSVSFNRIGDVLLALGDKPSALDAFRASLTTLEALVERDPANVEWQRGLIVGNSKLAEATQDSTFNQTALKVAEDMQRRGVLAPCDAWMIDELKQRIGQASAD